MTDRVSSAVSRAGKSARPPTPPRLAVDMRMLRASGIGTYLRQLVSRLIGIEGRTLALLGDVPELRHNGFDRVPGTTLHRCDAPIYSIREQIALRRSTPGGVELFWSPHYNIPLLLGAKLVVTVHDTLHLARPEYVRGSHRRIYARTMFRQLRGRANAIICDSHFTADELIRYAGIAEDRIEVIHLGVDESWFEPVATSSPRPRPYFVYVGNVKPHKNLMGLLEGFSLVLADLPHDLIIIGKNDGFISGDDRAIARAARMGKRVTFTGEVADATLRAYIGHAEALVLPSYYEGFGLPALEAMAAGCPALVSRVASLPEVCGQAALYFDPRDPVEIADRLRQVAQDRVLREELIVGGRERARRFTWDRCASETAAVLDRVLAVG